jgi:hypothetical protein
MIRCTNQQNRMDHYCSVCDRQMGPGESYWRDDRADIVCDDCAGPVVTEAGPLDDPAGPECGAP